MRLLLFILIVTGIFTSSGCIEDQFSVGTSGENNGLDVYGMRPQAVTILRQALKDNSDLIRIHAIEVVATTGRKELMPIVTTLLRSYSIGVRFSAAVAIGDMRYSPGEYAVSRLLNDKDENAKIAAAYALTKLGREDYSSLIRNAINSNDQTVRANSALLLGKMGDPKDLESLYLILQDLEASDKVKIQAIEAIAMLGDERIYQKKLWALLISKYADDRVMGIKAMGALGTEDARNAIMTMLDDDVLEIRLCAAEQLGKLGDRAGETEVLEYFTKKSLSKDRASIVQANMLGAMAIGQIGGNSLTKFLPGLMKDRSKVVRLRAAQAVLLLAK